MPSRWDTESSESSEGETAARAAAVRRRRKEPQQPSRRSPPPLETPGSAASSSFPSSIDAAKEASSEGLPEAKRLRVDREPLESEGWLLPQEHRLPPPGRIDRDLGECESAHIVMRTHGLAVDELRLNSLISGCRDLNSYYELLNKISEGSFGCVFRGRSLETGKIVALKSIKIPSTLKPEGFPLAALREISGLLDLRHPNVVEVVEVVVDEQDKQYMVTEYVEHELKVLLTNRRPEFSLSEKKRLMYEILEGVAYIHSKGYVHRDLKTANLLYTNNGIVKICDFGLAKRLITNRHTATVATLWYRPPECLLYERDYGPAVDMWAVGCIFGEILTGKPLFPATSELDALQRICQLTGSPTSREEWPLLTERWSMTLPKCRPSWRVVFPLPTAAFMSGSVTETGIDLLRGLLLWNADRRLTATQALKHPFFEESPKPQSVPNMPSAPETNVSVHRRRDSSEEGERRRVNPLRYLAHLEVGSKVR